MHGCYVLLYIHPVIYAEGYSLFLLHLLQLKARDTVTAHGTHCLKLPKVWVPKFHLCVHHGLLIGCCLGGLGGAVAVDTSQATVGGSVFSDNSAKSQGGALYQVSKSIAAL